MLQELCGNDVDVHGSNMEDASMGHPGLVVNWFVACMEMLAPQQGGEFVGSGLCLLMQRRRGGCRVKSTVD